MRMTVLSVGKLKERYLTEAVNEYMKRLRAYAQVEMVEVADEKAPDNLSAAQEEQVKAAEGQRILQKVKPEQMAIVLAIEGETLSSEAFARQIADWSLHGRSDLVFIIGGSLGLHEQVLKRADLLLSFSSMTFPHQLMRVILLEQIYRAFRINKGEPYHK